MLLDMRTLLIVLVILYACLGFVCLMLPYRMPGSRTVTYWGYALLALAAGAGGIALRGMIPDFLSIVLANALILASLVFVSRSTRHVAVRSRDIFAWNVVLVSALLLGYFTYMRPDMQMRIVLMSVAMAILTVRPLLALIAADPEATRRARRFTAACLGGIGLIIVARAALTAEFGSSANLLATDMAQFAGYLMFGMLAVLATLGVLWTEIEQLQSELARLAMIDQLTGTLNRRAFMIEYERELSRCKRANGGLALAIFDLDHFKTVNDNYGHLVGDQVLRTVADKLRASLRAHDVLGRYGGEEFALLLPGADRDAAAQVVERARLAVSARPIEGGGYSIPLTVSAGVASYGSNGTDWETLLQGADMALYEAKGAGRNRVVAAGGTHAAPSAQTSSV